MHPAAYKKKRKEKDVSGSEPPPRPHLNVARRLRHVD